MKGLTDEQLAHLLAQVVASLPVLALERAIRLARLSPNDFTQICFADGSGQALRQAAVHRALQARFAQPSGA